jgi:hypothetical protein
MLSSEAPSERATPKLSQAPVGESRTGSVGPAAASARKSITSWASDTDRPTRMFPSAEGLKAITPSSTL